LVRRLPTGPVIYTGGLENHPDVTCRPAADRDPLGHGRAEAPPIRDPRRLKHRPPGTARRFPRPPHTAPRRRWPTAQRPVSRAVGAFVLEVNPRYAAAVEVLELAHQRPVAFAGSALVCDSRLNGTVGKAVYYAPFDLTFPSSGPWERDRARLWHPCRMPRFSDV